MKRLFLITIVFTIITYSASLGITAVEPSIIDKANNWLLSEKIIRISYFETENDRNKALNTEKYITGTRKTIVYGEPHGDTVTINGGKRNRYLGYTMSDAQFTNYLYPDDSNDSRSYYDRGYNKTGLVKKPWLSTKTRKHFAVIDSDGLTVDNYFCGKPEFETYIREGLRIRSRDEMKRQGVPVDYPTVDFTKSQIESINWYEYTYIIQPPTDYSWGCGVLFRNDGDGYLTIPIPPNRFTPTPSPIPTKKTTPS